jgi:hypothetical protein
VCQDMVPLFPPSKRNKALCMDLGTDMGALTSWNSSGHCVPPPSVCGLLHSECVACGRLGADGKSPVPRKGQWDGRKKHPGLAIMRSKVYLLLYIAGSPVYIHAHCPHYVFSPSPLVLLLHMCLLCRLSTQMGWYTQPPSARSTCCSPPLPPTHLITCGVQPHWGTTQRPPSLPTTLTVMMTLIRVDADPHPVDPQAPHLTSAQGWGTIIRARILPSPHGPISVLCASLFHIVHVTVQGILRPRFSRVLHSQTSVR